MRAGETMENSLRAVVKDCKMGKILIQTNENTMEPELYYLRLPTNIQNYKIFLMDATVASGLISAEYCKFVGVDRFLTSISLAVRRLEFCSKKYLPRFLFFCFSRVVVDYKLDLGSLGAAAMMAIRILLDHDVLEENIFLLSLLMAEAGVHSLAYAFPKVTVETVREIFVVVMLV